MTEYMPRVGSMGLDMMRRTCTVQVSLCFGFSVHLQKNDKLLQLHIYAIVPTHPTLVWVHTSSNFAAHMVCGTIVCKPRYNLTYVCRLTWTMRVKQT